MNKTILEVVLDLKDNLSPKTAVAANKTKRSLAGITKETKNMQAGFKAGIAQMAVMAAALMAIVLAARKFITAIKEWVAAAIVQERAINTLNASLIASGNYTAEVSQELQAYATALQGTLGIGDEVTLQTLGMIEGLTKLGGEALPMAMDAVIQISKLYKTDYNAAALLLGKTLSSNLNAFARYGIQVDMAKDAHGRLIQIMEGTVAGMAIAEAQAKSYEGETIKLVAAWGDLHEELGFFITQSPGVVSSIDWITKALMGTTQEVKTLHNTIGDFTGIALVTLLLGSIEAAKKVLNISIAFHEAALAIAKFQQVVKWFTTGDMGSDPTIQGNIDAIVALRQSIIELTGSQASLAAGFVRATIQGVTFADTQRSVIIPALNNTADATDIAATAVSNLALEFRNLIDVQAVYDKQQEQREGVFARPSAFPESMRPQVTPFTPPGELFGRRDFLTNTDLSPKDIEGGGQIKFTNKVMQNLVASMISGGAKGGAGGAIASALPILGQVALGPIGGAIGSIIGNLFGRKRQRGESPQTPIYTSDVNVGNTLTEMLNITKTQYAGAAAGGMNQIDVILHEQGSRTLGGPS